MGLAQPKRSQRRQNSLELLEKKASRHVTNRLKLIAMDSDDLSVISAYCQDAVMKISDLQYFPREKRFLLAMNRFVWEESKKGSKNYERRRAALHFERVENVRLQDINRQKGDAVLSLLAITFNAGEAPAGIIELAFSAGATLQLQVECVEAQLSDMAAAWETASRPDHEVGE